MITDLRFSVRVNDWLIVLRFSLGVRFSLRVELMIVLWFSLGFGFRLEETDSVKVFVED